MSSTNGEEPTSKKKKPSTEPNSIHSLPDDLIVSCLARASRLHYPIHSLVSKSFRSVLASPEIYQTRLLLNRTEKCLYVCLQFPSELNPRWFTLCKKPNQTLTKKTKKEKEKEVSSGSALALIRTLNSPILEGSNLVSGGCNLYAIWAIKDSRPYCSNVSFLDCRTHTWFEAPSMRIAHSEKVYFPGFNENEDSSLDCIEIDGLLYLPGSNKNQDSSSLSCIEVFNPKTQTWNRPLPPPDKRLFKLKNMERKIYIRSAKNRAVAYKPKESTWELVELDNLSDSLCMIENVTYFYKGGFNYLYTKSNVPRKLNGLEGLPKFAGYSNVKLVDYGGNLVVLWDKYMPARDEYKEKKIWCAEISLEKRNNGEEIWGKVEWVDAVLTVPKSYKFVYAIAATV